jgi:hypothetical protein
MIFNQTFCARLVTCMYLLCLLVSVLGGHISVAETKTTQSTPGLISTATSHSQVLAHVTPQTQSQPGKLMPWNH